ncbi:MULTISPECIES: AI-2E family transporter [unclassified Nocardioides]|uniref:AI-2E family transporter n=1 Tax=unclassified Nocardioides TaxID=2615069 RepID=UPI0009E67C6C|nr:MULTISPECIES: AI-2E family transporter [unclassified Nocardioides]
MAHHGDHGPDLDDGVDDAAVAAEAAERAEDAAERAELAEDEVEEHLEKHHVGERHLGQPGPPIGHSPYYIGFFGGLGLLTAYWLGQQVLAIGSTLVLVVVSMFLAAGLNPLVEWFERRGMRRSLAVLSVIVIVLIAIGLFISAIVPVISEQVAALTSNAPHWLDQLQENKRVQKWNEDYDLIQKAKDYIEDGNLAQRAFGGVLGFGLAVLSALLNAFIVIVLTLYFLASLPKTKAAFYRLAPASRRDRVTRLGDRVLQGIGGYVSGAFVVAVCASLASLVFLFIVGLGEYAVALSFVVGLLSLIPMVGATIAMLIVSAIGFTISPGVGIACLVYYALYQQLENYVIYPRVMQRSVSVPGSVTVIAALVGGGLLGVVGALMAVPTAAAILLLTQEVFVRRQDER